MRSISFLMALGLSVLTPICSAQEVGPDGLSTAQLEAFVTSLKAAVKANDPTRLRDLIAFPLRVNSKSGRHLAVSQKDFAVQYPRVFTPDVRAVVLQQEASTLFRNSNGAMFGNGQVWVSGVCRTKDCKESDVKVISVSTRPP